MTDNTTTNTAAIDDKVARLQEANVYLTAQLDAAKQQRAFAVSELAQLKQNLQRDLAEWADENLQSDDDSYRELHELMQSNGLDGLKRTFAVTVRVTYEFEVEVEAADEDAAQTEVDDNLCDYANNYINVGWDSPYDTEFEVSEI